MGNKTGQPRGRPAGSKSKVTRKREDELKAAALRIEAALDDPFLGDSHDLLIFVYKDQSLPWATRIDAAKAAISYEKPRLAAIEHSGNAEKPLTLQVVSGVPRDMDDMAQLVIGSDAESHTNH